MKKFVLFLLMVFISLFLLNQNSQMEADSHFTPAYSKADLNFMIHKKHLTPEDYSLLFYQTGLAPSAVNKILSTDTYPLETLYAFQESFFAPVAVECLFNTPFSKEEKIIGSKSMLAPCEDAYILITNASHVLFYRNGHAGLIINAGKGQTLEAIMPGADSTLQSLEKWRSYPNFILLKLKNPTPGLTANICTTAMQKLNAIPYRLTSGIWDPAPDNQTAITGTHCSHLVWSAFILNGINVDSDGGRIVTPHDISGSPFLEIVQIYGLDPSVYRYKY